MRKVLVVLIAVGWVVAHAQVRRETSPQQQLVTTCNFEAKSRALKGGERSRFVASCLSEGNKRLQQVLKACNERAQGKGGPERQKFMAECLRG